MGKGKKLAPNWRKIDRTKIKIDSTLKEIQLENLEGKFKNKCRKCRIITDVCPTCNYCYNPNCKNFGCPWCQNKRKLGD